MAIGPNGQEAMHVGMAELSTSRIVPRPAVRANYRWRQKPGAGRCAKIRAGDPEIRDYTRNALNRSHDGCRGRQCC